MDLVRTVNEGNKPNVVNQPQKVEERPLEQKVKLHPFEETVTVPSLGKFYGGKLPGGKVKIRPIEVIEEKLMYNVRDKVAVLNKILDRCVLTKTMPLRDYLLTDRFFLLLNIFIISYGPTQEHTYACPSCDNKFKRTVDMTKDLLLKVASDDDVEPFIVPLPMSKKTLLVRFLRGYDEEAISLFTKQNTNSEEGDPAYSYSIARSIVSIDGKEVDESVKYNFCEHLHARDSAVLRSTIEKNSTGVELVIKVECPLCHESFRRNVDLSTQFFRPTN